MPGRWVHEKGAPWPVWVDDTPPPVEDDEADDE